MKIKQGCPNHIVSQFLYLIRATLLSNISLPHRSKAEIQEESSLENSFFLFHYFLQTLSHMKATDQPLLKILNTKNKTCTIPLFHF